MSKKSINFITLLSLIALTISLIGNVNIVQAKTTARTAAKVTSKTTKKSAIKIKKVIKLKPTPKPTAAEIKMAKQQLVMERNYASYIKGVIKKTKKTGKKKTLARKVSTKKTTIKK